MIPQELTSVNTIGKLLLLAGIGNVIMTAYFTYQLDEVTVGTISLAACAFTAFIFIVYAVRKRASDIIWERLQKDNTTK